MDLQGVASNVAWGNERFVAVGDYTIIHSSNGDSWQSRP